MRARQPLVVRFWRHVQKTEGCWLWTSTRQSYGYGVLKVRIADGKKKVIRMHRFSYELHFGPIPEGMHVCHHCDNPRCVRPTHLFLGTDADNVADAIRKGRMRNHNKEKTHCKRGHEFTPENTQSLKGGRQCKACKIEQQRARRASNASAGEQDSPDPNGRAALMRLAKVA